MDNTSIALAGHTKKYNIPLSHLEHKFIQNCTDGKTLEHIYKELITGELGAFPDLEKLTLERIRIVKPNSQLLRNDKSPLDKSALPDDERRQFDDFLNKMNHPHRTTSIISKDQPNNFTTSVPIRSKSIIGKSITPTPSASVIKNNGKPKRIVPRSYEEWGKLDQKYSRESNSEDEDEDEDEDDDDHVQKNNKTQNKTQQNDHHHEKSQRLQMAEQHRLNGNTAFKSNNYQQSVDLYTNSIMLNNTNPVVYMNRAIAYFKLNNIDASINDCSHVLSTDPRHIKALFRRASCFIAKKQYEEAKRDLDNLLIVEPENNDAKNLLKTIPVVQKPKGVRIPITEDDGDENERINTQSTESVKIPIVEVEEEEEEQEQEQQSQTQMNNGITSSKNIDIPQKPNVHARPCIDSQEASPVMSDPNFQSADHMHNFQQNVHSQLSSFGAGAYGGGDDDDDMALGDEASPDVPGNISDDDGNASTNVNVSPMLDDEDDDEPPELIEPRISPMKRTMNISTIDQQIAFTTNQTYNRPDVSTQSNNYATNHQNSTSSNQIENRQRSPSVNMYENQISDSNFSPIIQEWLRDLSVSQTSRSSGFGRLWSQSPRPHGLDNLQFDIDRFNRIGDLSSTIDASKKMLKNGALDYHFHAEHIISTLLMCANCYLKKHSYTQAVQFTSEALLYNKIDSTALLCRAKAFENEKFLLFSYADYARISSRDLNHDAAKAACTRLAVDLNSTEGKAWNEKLPKDNDDAERFITYFKIKDEYKDNKEYDWYRTRGNQLYLDGCFVLAILCYTHCIKLKSNVAFLYSNRAACYLKVYELQKAIADCNKALEIEPKDVRALYRKAYGYKMSHNMILYQSTLKDLLVLQPNNQMILSEYYSSQQEQIPRKMRRIRTNPIAKNSNESPSSTTKSTDTNRTTTTFVIDEYNLSYEELEQIRSKKLFQFSENAQYHYTQQLSALKSNDIKGQCSFVLRLPRKSLPKVVTSATSQLLNIVVHVCQTMISAEKRYQQEHKNSIQPFSYIKFCFDILTELTTLSRIDSALSMIDQHSRAVLDDLLSYYSSISTAFPDIHKLNRLRK